jgi:hypothetical protein
MYLSVSDGTRSAAARGLRTPTGNRANSRTGSATRSRVRGRGRDWNRDQTIPEEQILPALQQLDSSPDQGLNAGANANRNLPNETPATFGPNSSIFGDNTVIRSIPRTPAVAHPAVAHKTVFENSWALLRAIATYCWVTVSNWALSTRDNVKSAWAAFVNWVIIAALYALSWIVAIINWFDWKSFTAVLVVACLLAAYSPVISSGSFSSPSGSFRSYGLADIKHNIGQFIPFSVAHPISYLTDSELYDLKRRLSAVEYGVAHLQNQNELNKNTIQELQRILPEFIAMKKDKSGKKEIPSEFWESLEDHALWDKFLEKNQKLVDAKISKSFSTEYEKNVQKSLKDRVLVSRREVISMVNSHYSDSLPDVRAEIAKLGKEMESRLSIQLKALAATHTSSTKVEDRRINWFSENSGAVIDARVTSDNYNYAAKRLGLFKRGMLALIGRGLANPNPPIVALEAWEEHGDSWCTPLPNEVNSKPAQLGILISRPVIPTQIIVEHALPNATLSSGTTPRVIEIFAHVPNYDSRILASDRSIELYGDNKQHLSEEWVKISEFNYHFAYREAQSFPIELDLGLFSTSTRRMVVRVTDIWGDQDHTCIYRVKMHGDLASPSE